MIDFFIIYIDDVTNNEQISISKYDGSATPFVILDDGWAPNLTKYVRDGEKTWSDVVEELECMTNVATRDEALALLEKLNALIHRAARDIEEKQTYTIRFAVRSQFSNAPNSAFTHIISPPDDGNVITLSTDIQTAPPGQIKFKLRFKRTGAWITTFNDITHSFTLLSEYYGYRGIYFNVTQLPTTIQQPTPISLLMTPISNGTGSVDFETLFLCVNIQNVNSYKDFYIPTPFDMYAVSYSSSLLAQNDYGYRIVDNTDSYSTDIRPNLNDVFDIGTYAVFVSWRSVTSSVSHKIQIQFDNNTETPKVLLSSNDTKPKITYVGTITMTIPAYKMFLRTTIGHSTGFELEKIVLVKLKTLSNIIELRDFWLRYNHSFSIENSVTNLVKKAKTTSFFSTGYTNILTYNSLDIVADSQQLAIAAIGHSPDFFALKTSDYKHAYNINTIVKYRPIRTTFH